jgi:hypothetical protein
LELRLLNLEVDLRKGRGQSGILPLHQAKPRPFPSLVATFLALSCKRSFFVALGPFLCLHQQDNGSDCAYQEYQPFKYNNMNCVITIVTSSENNTSVFKLTPKCDSKDSSYKQNEEYWLCTQKTNGQRYCAKDDQDGTERCTVHAAHRPCEHAVSLLKLKKKVQDNLEPVPLAGGQKCFFFFFKLIGGLP